MEARRREILDLAQHVQSREVSCAIGQDENWRKGRLIAMVLRDFIEPKEHEKTAICDGVARFGEPKCGHEILISILSRILSLILSWVSIRISEAEMLG